MNDQEPEISVIIVNWNVGHLLLECLDSLMADLQEVEAEIIVVDNASTDNSVELVKHRHPNVEVVETLENVGFARANNLALRRSRGRYLLLLNPDTRVLPGTVPALVRFMDYYLDAGIAGCKQIYADGRWQSTCHRMITLRREATVALGLSRLLPRWVDYGDLPLRLTRPFRVDWVGGACLITRRNLVERVGLLDENLFMYAEDADLCHQVRQLGYFVYYLPNVSIIHHRGKSIAKLSDTATSVTSSKLALQYKARRYVIRKHYGDLRATIYCSFVAVEFTRKLLQTTVSQLLPLPISRKIALAAEREAYLSVLAAVIKGRL